MVRLIRSNVISVVLLGAAAFWIWDVTSPERGWVAWVFLAVVAIEMTFHLVRLSRDLYEHSGWEGL